MYNNNNNNNYSDFKNDKITANQYSLNINVLILKKILKTIGKIDYYPELIHLITY